MRLFHFHEREIRVDFCDACGRVCDNGCRRDAVREQAQLRALANGWRVG